MPFSARLAIQQRVLPNYRRPFFDALAGECQGGLSVFAGQPRPNEAIEVSRSLQTANCETAHNLHLFSGPYYFCWQRGLRQWLDRWNPQALVVEANPRYLSTGQAIRWMKARRRPVLGWGLGSPAIHGSLAGIQTRVRTNFIQQFDGMITYSQQGATEYRAFGFPADRIWVAPNAMTRSPAWSLPVRAADFRDRPVVLFVGRLQARKRIDNLLNACAALPDALKPKVWIVGDGPARAQFEAVAAEIYPEAEFPGARHGDDLVPYFLNADLFVLPGTGGLAIQQAMAYGLPVIAAEADGTQDDLVRPENGWQVKPGDIQDLTSVMQAALSNPAKLRQMGKVSYQIAKEEINLERMVTIFLEAISTCLNSK